MGMRAREDVAAADASMTCLGENGAEATTRSRIGIQAVKDKMMMNCVEWERGRRSEDENVAGMLGDEGSRGRVRVRRSGPGEVGWGV